MSRQVDRSLKYNGHNLPDARLAQAHGFAFTRPRRRFTAWKAHPDPEHLPAHGKRHSVPYIP